MRPIFIGGCLAVLSSRGASGFAGPSSWRRASSIRKKTTTTTRSSTSTSLAAVTASKDSQLAQLASMTVLSIDSGDLNVIRDYAATGYITDATTNPLFVSQAGLSGDPVYAAMVDDAVRYAIAETKDPSQQQEEIVALAIDRLAVNLGAAIADIVPGYISTEVDPRLSFDADASVERALRIIQMYRTRGVGRDRVLVKLAATWEGIQAAHVLETRHGVRCNLTLVFGVVQAVACAQHNAHLVSPFPGRILDWHNAALKRDAVADPALDEGVAACTDMFNYYKCHGHDTICMPASWRPSRGAGHELDEIRALAGSDRMTIPAPLLERLAACEEPLERKLTAERARATQVPEMGRGGRMGETEFRYRLAMDGCGNDKLAEGIRSFVELTEALEAAIADKVRAALSSSSSEVAATQ